MRQPTIPLTHDRDLYAYIFGILKNMGCFVLRINGMPDHIHILTTIPPQISVSDTVKKIKQSSSNWLKSNPDFPKWYGWNNGFAVLSLSDDEISSVKQYICQQKEHHRNALFADEYDKMVRSMGYTKHDGEIYYRV